MPRQPRLVVPGGLFHLIARGNERRKIYLDSEDYSDFLDRLGVGLDKSQCRCLAWVLMPNHFHLLIQSGPDGTAPLMRRLMTGYVGYFNRRHRREGHLFQNRYKAILCDKDTYLLELVRYIHLNPVRAGIVKTLDQLKYYPWTGHGTLMGHKPREFQSVDVVLSGFSSRAREAQSRYLEFMKAGINQGKREDLMGGGLQRSLGRSPDHRRGLKRGEVMAYDDRILGDGPFVKAVLKEGEKRQQFRSNLSVNEIAEGVAKHMSVRKEDLFIKGRREAVSRAKALLIYIGTRYKLETAKGMGEMTGMSPQAASKARDRGQAIWEMTPALSKLIN